MSFAYSKINALYKLYKLINSVNYPKVDFFLYICTLKRNGAHIYKEN